MKLNSKNLQKMSGLREQRTAVRQKLIGDVTGLRNSIKPSNLARRAKNVIQGNLADAGNIAAENAKKHATLLAAIGAGLTAAVLYRPVKVLLDKTTGQESDEASTTEFNIAASGEDE